MDAQLKNGTSRCVRAGGPAGAGLLRLSDHQGRVAHCGDLRVHAVSHPQAVEAGGFVTTYSMEHNSRLRKYYRLTDQGRQRIRDFLVEWQDVMRAYRYIAASQEGGATPLRKDETP